jgi:hypothetical protein
MNEDVTGTKEICIFGLKTLIYLDMDLTRHVRGRLVEKTSALK